MAYLSYRNGLALGACILAVAASTPAFANDATSQTAAPSDRSAQPDMGPSIEFLSLSGDERVSLQLQGGSKRIPFKASGSRSLSIRQMQWKVTASSPLNKDAEFSDIATLDSLANGFKFEIGLSGQLTKLFLASGDSLNEAHQAAIRKCERQRSADIADCTKLPKDTADISRFVNLENGSHRGTTKWGANVAIGYNEFDYRDRNSLAELSEDKVGYAAEAYVAHLFPSGETSISGHVAYELGYEAGKKQILCPFNAGPGPVQCFNDPASPPKKDKSLLIKFDLRQYLGEALGTSFAIAPLVTYDTSDDVVGIDVPLYVISDGDFGLTGGIRAGWRSDTKDVVVGIFVGKAFGPTTK
jgi:hypothetical protein